MPLLAEPAAESWVTVSPPRPPRCTSRFFRKPYRLPDASTFSMSSSTMLSPERDKTRPMPSTGCCRRLRPSSAAGEPARCCGGRIKSRVVVVQPDHVGLVVVRSFEQQPVRVLRSLRGASGVGVGGYATVDGRRAGPPSVLSRPENSAKKKSALRHARQRVSNASGARWAMPPPAMKSLPLPPKAVSWPRPPKKMLPLVALRRRRFSPCRRNGCHPGSWPPG